MKVNFKDYGEIEYIEAQDFYSDAWTIVEACAEAEDGEQYTLIAKDGELACAII